MKDSLRVKRQGYIFGFVGSLILTMLAYLLVSSQSMSMGQLFNPAGLIVGLAIIAVVQLFVQLFFFLHLGQESRPRWNLLGFGFAAIVVIIVVVGSLWIMNNLNYNMMTPQAMDQYMRAQSQKGF